MLWMTTKNDLHKFLFLFENFSGSNGGNRRGIRVFIDAVEISTTNPLMKKI